jgi:hypothetical protein
MNQGIEILLKRMESHPHEFDMEWGEDGSMISRSVPAPSDVSKWSFLLSQLASRVDWEMRNARGPGSPYPWSCPVPFLSTEEVFAAWDKYKSLQGDAFTRHVMRQLLEDKKEAATATGSWVNANPVRFYNNPPENFEDMYGAEQKDEENEEVDTFGL